MYIFVFFPLSLDETTVMRFSNITEPEERPTVCDVDEISVEVEDVDKAERVVSDTEAREEGEVNDDVAGEVGVVSDMVL